MPLGGAYRSRFGAPYCGVHRAELQRILGGALEGERLHLGRRVADLQDYGDRVVLKFADGASFEADWVIAADGVRSVARHHVAGDHRLLYSRTSGFRGIVPATDLPTLPDPEAIQFWMGPSAHLLHYAIGARAEHVNFLAVVEGPADWRDPEKGLVRSNPEEALAAFEGWHPAVTEMVRAMRHDVRWGLFLAKPLRRWRRGRVALLGDAAHAMLPHHGQGANTTIEDAVTLAERIGQDPENIEAALDAYESLRRARTRTIQRASWAANRAFHLADGPDMVRRNERVSCFPAEFGWISRLRRARSDLRHQRPFEWRRHSQFGP